MQRTSRNNYLLERMAYQLLLHHFRPDPIDKLKYHCLIDSCEKAIIISKSNKSHNLKRHLQTQHKEDYEKTFADLTQYQVQRLKLIHSSVELVTVNGRPILALEDTGYQKSIEFQLNYLTQHGCKLTINHKTIRPYIEHVADTLREKIKTELKGRLISIMADIATKNHRGVLGINVQYYSEGKIVLRTIGAIEMHIRHFGENIKDLILQLLNSYGVSIDQVHSYTTDCGANMISSGKFLDAAANEQLSEADIDFDFSPTGKFAEIIKTLSDLFGRDCSSMQLPSVAGIGCAAHVLQTIIHDALKKTYELTLIVKVRGIMVELRGQIYMIELEARGAKLPILDGLTRWNSIYLMVCTKNTHVL